MQDLYLQIKDILLVDAGYTWQTNILWINILHARLGLIFIHIRKMLSREDICVDSSFLLAKIFCLDRKVKVDISQEVFLYCRRDIFIGMLILY